MPLLTLVMSALTQYAGAISNVFVMRDTGEGAAVVGLHLLLHLRTI